jgi:hypothetical protein
LTSAAFPGSVRTSPWTWLGHRTGTVGVGDPARRKLQVALGVIWLIDAALQYQPYMFSRAFVTETIEPAAYGTPYIVEHPSLWAANIMIHHIAAYNAVFATIQLFIAVCLFYRPALKVGLAISIVWSLGVWWLAEGIGGITLGATALMGAPGAALLYAFIAVLVWPSSREDAGRQEGRSVVETGPLPALVAKLAWAALWLGLAALGLEAVNRSPSALHDMVVGMQAGEPAWIRAINRFLGGPLAHHGTEWSIVLAVLYVLAGIGVFAPRTARPALMIAVVLAAAIWLTEDFGGIATGSGTDVNSGPLLALLAACFWPVLRPRPVRTPGSTSPETRRGPVRQTLR